MSCKMLLYILIVSVSTPAIAQCRMAAAGAACSTPPVHKIIAPPPRPAPVEIGAIIPRGKYSMVMDAQWYGLPPAQDGWIYYRIKDDVYRVDYRTMEVLERATDEAGQNWP